MNRLYRRWRDEDVEFIKDNYIKMTDNSIAVTLSRITGDNISTDMIRRQRRKYRLSRPKGRPSN